MEPLAASMSHHSVHTSPWADLPTDLILDVSGRLRDSRDFVRFHAICQPWRDAAPPPPLAVTPPRCHTFLPSLILQQNDLVIHSRMADLGSISLDETSGSRSSYIGNILEGSPSKISWVAGANGEAIWLFERCPEPTLHDLVTGAITHLTAFPDKNYVVERRMRKPHGVVYGDGTIFLYSFVSEQAPGQYLDMYFFTAAILRPGDMAWTIVEKRLDFSPCQNSCAAFHKEKVILLVSRNSWCVVTPGLKANSWDDIAGATIQMMPDTTNNDMCARNYFLESGGELFWVSVLIKHDRTDKRISYFFETALVVKVHVLEEQGDGDSVKMRWVERDGRSFSDRVLFLGLPSSFAVNASQLDVEGGCAYFLLCGRLLRCCFSDIEPEFTVGPALGCDINDACLWFKPQPVISPIAEIRGRVQTQNKKKKISSIL